MRLSTPWAGSALFASACLLVAGACTTAALGFGLVFVGLVIERFGR